MFDWAYLDSVGEEIGRSDRFDDPDSAEEWISVSWRDLADIGVEEVALFDHARGCCVYRMGLGIE